MIIFAELFNTNFLKWDCLNDTHTYLSPIICVPYFYQWWRYNGLSVALNLLLIGFMCNFSIKILITRYSYAVHGEEIYTKDVSND